MMYLSSFISVLVLSLQLLTFPDRPLASNFQYDPATIKTHFNHVLCVVSPAPAQSQTPQESIAMTNETTSTGPGEQQEASIQEEVYLGLFFAR